MVRRLPDHSRCAGEALNERCSHSNCVIGTISNCKQWLLQAQWLVSNRFTILAAASISSHVRLFSGTRIDVKPASHDSSQYEAQNGVRGGRPEYMAPSIMPTNAP